MSQAERSSNVEPEVHKLRRGSLGVLAISFFVISAAAPLTAVAGGAPVAMLLGNGSGIPAAYVVVSVLLLVFSVGYTAMARHHTSTGAFYSYVTRGLGQPTGGAAAWIALLGYNTMQIGLYGLFGSAPSGFLADQFGWDVPWWPRRQPLAHARRPAGRRHRHHRPGGLCRIPVRPADQQARQRPELAAARPDRRGRGGRPGLRPCAQGQESAGVRGDGPSPRRRLTARTR